jgi:predicted small integral membrane protein
MFTNNPFAELSASISPSVQQTYIIVMVILVVVGTVYDTLHKKSAVSIAIKTAIVDVAASGEFCSAPRRIAHLLTMYGFLAYAIATAVMVFWYPTPETTMPAIVAQLWHIGALMVCLGGYWFWFFIRVDVAAEGSSPFRIMRADLFILSLLMSATFALVWAYLQATDNSWAMAAFGLHIIATTVLFGSVAWSKFAHMFFKPAAAFEKRVSAANGSRSNLPPPADKPESFGSAGYQPRNY